MVEAQTIGTVPVSIWKLKADEQSKAQPKTSEGGESLDSIQLQLTEEVKKNKKNDRRQ
jgi:hypothetical protein